MTNGSVRSSAAQNVRSSSMSLVGVVLNAVETPLRGQTTQPQIRDANNRGVGVAQSDDVALSLGPFGDVERHEVTEERIASEAFELAHTLRIRRLSELAVLLPHRRIPEP